MRNLAHTAGYMALRELGAGRVTMILFPNSSWGAVALEMGTPPDDIWLRFSDRHASLRSIVIHTLILVAADDPDWDADGILLAKEKLRAILEPKLVLMYRNREDEILEGSEIWDWQYVAS